MIPRPTHATRFERIATRSARIAAAMILFLLVAPMAVVLPLSFTAGSLLIFPLPGLSTQWYAEFFTHSQWVNSLRNSFLIALPTTLLSTAVGTLAAIGLSRLRSRFVPLVVGFLVTPLVVPVIIFAVAAFYFYAWLDLVGTYAGIVVAHSILSIPFVVVTVSATLQGYDPTLGRAAAASGANPRQAFFYVTLPLIFPGVMSGALFAFVTSFDELIVTIFLAAPEQRTLPRQLWSGVQETINPTITAAAVILMLVSMLLMFWVEYLRRRSARLRGEQLN